MWRTLSFVGYDNPPTRLPPARRLRLTVPAGYNHPKRACHNPSERGAGGAKPMARVIRAPRGTRLTCKNWLIEAAYRMLQNNLDPEVAGDPENLIVYGGRGKAARNWACFDA
ncbi:MAG: hypothetical protein ACP5R2_11415, partial [Anaerolineae bacterium]